MDHTRTIIRAARLFTILALATLLMPAIVPLAHPPTSLGVLCNVSGTWTTQLPLVPSV